MNIPLARFAPDRATHATDATSVVINVKPVTDGYAPMKELVTFSDALASSPRGQIAVRTATGSQATFAGTETGLYRLQSDGSWQDVTGASGPYAVPVDGEWSFDLFGTRIIATNGFDAVQYYDIGISTDFEDLPGSPPAARYVVVAGDFVWLLGLASNPAGYAFSGLNDSEQWTSGENFADIGAFPDGGEIMGGVSAGTGLYIVQRSTIRVATFNPASGFAFTIQVVDSKVGAESPFSIAKVGNGAFFFLSQDGFYLFDGQTRPVGAERVDKTVKAQADARLLKLCHAVADTDEKLIYVRIQKTDGSSIFYLYNYQLNEWAQSTQTVSAVGLLVTTSLSLEDLDTVFPLGMDAQAFSVDSNEFSGGAPALAGFSSDNRMGFFTGKNLPATLETGSMQLAPPRRAFVRQAQLVGDLDIRIPGTFDGTGIILDDVDIVPDLYVQPSFSIQIAAADYYSPESNLVWGGAILPNPSTGIVPMRSSGRVHRFRINIESMAAWRHVQGLIIDAIGEGDR